MASLEEQAERKKEEERYSLKCSLDASSKYIRIHVREHESQRAFENRFDKDALIECGFMSTQTLAQIKEIIESAMRGGNEQINYRVGFVAGRSGTLEMGYKGEGDHKADNYENMIIKDTYAEGDDMIIRIRYVLAHFKFNYILRLGYVEIEERDDPYEEMRKMEQRIKTERETKINAVIEMFGKEMQNKGRTINALEKQNAVFQAEMRQKEKMIELLQREMKKKEEGIESLKTEIRKREKKTKENFESLKIEIQSLKLEMRNEIKKKEKTIEPSQAEIKEKDEMRTEITTQMRNEELQRITLTVHQHRGHCGNRDSCHPSNLLKSDNSFYYSKINSAFSPNEPDWITFKIKEDKLFTNITQFRIWNNNDIDGVSLMRISVSRDNNNWTDIAVDIKVSMKYGWQTFPINHSPHLDGPKFIKVCLLKNHGETESYLPKFCIIELEFIGK